MPSETSGRSRRYARHLPSRQTDEYAAGCADPDRLLLHEELALLETRIGELLDRCQHGEDDGRAWNEIRATIEQRRKLVDTEIKRVATGHKILTQEQSLALIGRIQSLVLQYLTNDDDRRAFAAGLRALAAP